MSMTVFSRAQKVEPAPESDLELLRRCRDGDAAAWDALVARYERLVFSVALRNGLKREDAADVTQTTFEALLDSLSRLREDDRLSWWLMTVARRQAWRVRRRTDRELLGDENLTVRRADGPSAGGADEFVSWEAVADLHDALAKVSDPCRSLLFLLYLDPESPSYEEIARRLGRAPGGVGPLRARCLARMRTLLEGPADA